METAQNTIERTDLTPPTIARMLGVKVAKVHGWINAGELDAWDSSIRAGVGKPRWRVSIDALEAFRRRRSNITTPRADPRRNRFAGIQQIV